MNRRPVLWLTVCAVLLAVQISSCWYATSDGCLYLAMARERSGLPSESAPRAESAVGIGVPPGYPLLIAPAFWFGERPFLALSVIHWLVAVASIVGVYVWGRRQIPQAAVWLAMLTAVNAGVWYYYRRTLKELAFMAVALWTVNAMQAVLAARTRRQLFWRLTLAATLLAAAILVRYSAIVLAVGFGIAVLLNHREASHGRGLGVAVILLLGTSAAAVLGYLVLNRGSSYLLGFEVLASNTLTRLTEGLRLRINDVERICVPGMFKAYADSGEWLDWNIALGVVLVGVIAIGWRRLALDRRDVLALTLPVYVGLYAAWPFNQGARFMVPMVPVFIACFWFAARRVQPGRHLFFAACTGCHLVTSLGYWALIDAPRAAADHVQWAAIDRLLEDVPRGSRKVAFSNLSNEIRCMALICLDEPPTVDSPTNDPTDADIEWIVQPTGDPAYRGFVVSRTADALRLLERRKPPDGIRTAAAPDGDQDPRLQ